MIRLKNLLAVAAVAVGLGFAATPSASAAHPPKVVVIGGYTPNLYPLPFPNPGPFPPPRVDFDFVVVYKPSIFTPPIVYGKFETLHGARIAALRLESFGYPVRIVPVRDYHNFIW
jgi:hypothetical protein